MPDDPQHAERLDRIYLTQDQLLKIVQAQAADSHVLRNDVGQIKNTLIGTLENPGGLAGVLRDTSHAVADHDQRIKSLEDSREEVKPIVASHKSRKKDWGAFKGSLIGVAAGGLGGWLWNKLTGKAP